MISVIIPVYNIIAKKRKLNAAIKSVLSQSYSDVELILVNDGSTDGSANYLASLVSDTVCVINKQNGGVESARREGLKHARGEFILHMDQDDLYMPGAFRFLIGIAEQTEADVVVSNNARFIFNKIIRFDGKRKTPFMCDNRVIDHDTFMKVYYQSFFGVNVFPVSIWNKLYRRSFLETVPDPPLTNCIIEDLSYNMHLLPYAKTIAVTPNITYLYRWGGWTNHYDPTILNTALIGYRLKKNLIEKYTLPFGKTTSIELINYLNSYFYGMLEYNKVSELAFKDEVNRVLNYPEVREACAEVGQGLCRFPHIEPIIKGEVDELYKIDLSLLKSRRIRNSIKKLMLFLSDV